MPEYKLHCFAESGNAYKAALMLELTGQDWQPVFCLLYTSPSPRDGLLSRMPSSA